MSAPVPICPLGLVWFKDWDRAQGDWELGLGQGLDNMYTFILQWNSRREITGGAKPDVVNAFTGIGKMF